MKKTILLFIFALCLFSVKSFGQEEATKYFVSIYSVQLAKKYYLTPFNAPNHVQPLMLFDGEENYYWQWFLDGYNIYPIETGVSTELPDCAFLYVPQASIKNSLISFEFGLHARRYWSMTFDTITQTRVSIDIRTLNFNEDGIAFTNPIRLKDDGGFVQLKIGRKSLPELSDTQLIEISKQEQAKKIERHNDYVNRNR